MKRYVVIMSIAAIIAGFGIAPTFANTPTGDVKLWVTPGDSMSVMANCFSDSLKTVKVTLQKFASPMAPSPVNVSILVDSSFSTSRTSYSQLWKRPDDRAFWFRAVLEAQDFQSNTYVAYSTWSQPVAAVSTMSTIGWIALAIVLVGLTAAAVKFRKGRTDLA